MNFSLLVQLCGFPLLIVLSVLSVVLSLVALYLAFGAKQESLLSAFLPMTILPAVAGLLMTFLDMVSSIGLQLDENTGTAIDSAFVLQMNLIPVLTGLVAAVPPACIVIIARWLCAWKASGIKLLEPKEADSDTSSDDHERWVANEADEYMEKLVRPR